jgi:3-oxoacyl-[acyl-carrier protein] reductase
MTRFDGKVVLVTGGARGIGAGCARRFASEGAKVAVTDLDFTDAECGEVLQLTCNVTSRDDVETAVRQTVDELGGLDFLITCAGITRDNLIFRLTDDDWDSVTSTHLRGTFLSIQAAQKVMVEQKAGKIVTVSSTSARGNRGQLNYAAAKAGIQGMTFTAAIELGPFGINVNCIAPGFIETRMTRAMSERMGVDFETIKQAAIENTPLRRIGQPADIAGVAAFLCSDDASFVTGQVVYVAGGH